MYSLFHYFVLIMLKVGCYSLRGDHFVSMMISLLIQCSVWYFTLIAKWFFNVVKESITTVLCKSLNIYPQMYL